MGEKVDAEESIWRANRLISERETKVGEVKPNQVGRAAKRSTGSG
jgi:hypothetical protein